MSRARPWIGLFLSAVVALASFGMLAVAARSKSQAGESLEDAKRLLQARLDVAKAQQALGSSDIGDAVESGRRANAIALRVGALTQRVVKLLTPLGASTKESVEQGRRGIRSAVVARRQTRVAAEILGAIAGYQQAAADDADKTIRALRRILRALRETNESIP